jgi:hypothetical protein
MLLPESAEYFFGGFRERFRCVFSVLINFDLARRVGGRPIVSLAYGMAREPGFVGGG